ncbi:hypothetical protein ES288_D11G175200v1 [Gossypium darwinii]|uniref:Uncharacterized protein n=2 Tax=Gossypium TaxID=3633 RepID=A0A5D2IPH4_GOSTO|nr:hypothetical protein ES288_D11G175200v1 [Gossypium darwinii]TYH44130.1 hypothetical protein ES332_D11G172100v1 [Gossypium tomentosum]
MSKMKWTKILQMSNHFGNKYYLMKSSTYSLMFLSLSLSWIIGSIVFIVLEATLGINFSTMTCLIIGYILISFNACMLLITVFFKMKEMNYLNFSKRIQIEIAASLSN